MVSRKNDIFTQPNPTPIVRTGSTPGQLELREQYIEKHSHASQKASPPAAEQKKKDKESAEDKMRDLARKSSQILYQLSTVFPFDFFPDTITINANKIDIVTSEFFFSHHTTSIPIKDIANVEMETTPFFATIQIINIRAPMRPISINYLRQHEAIKAKSIIDGLLVATEQGADISSIEPKKFLPHLERLGQSYGH